MGVRSQPRMGSPRWNAVEQADLVAYLDGELAEPEARAVATRLAGDPEARREVEAFEQVWDLLDHLPLPKAPSDFRSRTLSRLELPKKKKEKRKKKKK